MIRLALQQLLDTRVLPVREAELTVEWLFRDGAQKSSLAAGSVVAGELSRTFVAPRSTQAHTGRPGT